MLLRISPSSLKEGRWYEYFTRFALGGVATMFAGIVSSAFGASIGGLFLAMPAIFCASATLIERHEIRRKQEAGLSGERRGQAAAALEAAGASLGSIGMLGFALVFWWIVEDSAFLAFLGAAVVWTAVSVTAWWTYKRSPWRRRLS
jgi:hypothetical protein